MKSLLIVRHAQASFMAANYDQLSALGETQARLLGTCWSAANLRFDRVCAGPRERQKDTARIVASAYASAGQDFPDVELYPEFDEYHAERVMQAALPVLLESDPRTRELQAAFAEADQATERRITFQRLFEHVIALWVRGDLYLQGVESWHEFCQRVHSGLDRFLADQTRVERSVIFTSAGPLAVAVERALSISPEATLQMSWMPRNCSWSEFLYSSRRFNLSSFNCFTHLTDPEHLTYR